MKKSFYCYRDNKFDPPPNDNEYCNMDNEKRKLLSIETNRRRRDMAIRVRKQIEKEEERRKDVLRERREYHENMTNKMRKIRSTKVSKLQSQNVSKPWDLDQTLTLIRNHSSNPTINSAHNHDHSNSNYKTILEGAWNDFREGGSSSPMAKYSGVNSNSRPRTSNFYLKTFETKLMAQELTLKERQNSQMSEFIKILDDTIEGVDKFDDDNNNNSSHQNITQNSTFRVEEFCINSHKERNGDLKSEMKVEEILEDSLDESNDESMEVENNCKIEIPLELKKVVIPISAPVKSVSKDCTQVPIKSILKKDLHSHFNSNPDISGIVPRDSVEITRINSAKLKRCNSFSQYINYANHETSSDERSYLEEDSGRKIVRFADSPSLNKTKGLTTDTISSDKIMQCEMFQENVRNPINPKFPKQPTVPNSTPLKPPLHPRTVQEGSYVHATMKKQAVFHPPVKPRKISTETLDHEISLMNQKKTSRNQFCSSNVPDSSHSRENHIQLDRTPTEKEIDQLWAEVRECLSRSQYPSKTGSVGTPAGLSVRTIDSGSESSVRSAPTWQRSAKKTTSFQVRHHAPLTQKSNVYQGQGPPVKDFVIVHAPHEQYIHSEVIHQPLSVLTPEAQKFQQVSESLEEFLATENACRISQSARNVFPPHSPLHRPKIGQHLNCKVIVPSPSFSNPNSQNASNVQRTQMSMEEEKLKMSLDKLNERLKNIYM